MGFKLAAFSAPLNQTELSELVNAVYGGQHFLKPIDKVVEDMISYHDGAFTCVFGERVWIFDWKLVEKLSTPPTVVTPPLASCAWFVLGSVTNFYGFCLCTDGHVVRSRAGTADDGIIQNDGDFLTSERTALQEIADAHEMAFSDVETAWTNADAISVSNDVSISHDSIGEDVVFAVMKTTVGIDFVNGSDATDAFLNLPVQRIVKRGLLSKLFG